ncbi:Ig-like domain-containing protein, partial [Clostridium sp. DSM 17811]|uniref:Ig-like domain-containing protein n=1 Tax=Clostridium sp. DSM 17811 TaxID=2843317 RepID=UPI001C0DCEC3
SKDVQALISDLKDGGADVFLKEGSDGKYYSPSDKLNLQSAEIAKLLIAANVDIKNPTAIKTYIKNNAATIMAAIKVETDKAATQTVDTSNYTEATQVVGTKDIVSIAYQHPFLLNTGVTLSEMLPTEVKATLADNSTTNVAVTFDEGIPSYDSSKPGLYVLTGTMDLFSGVTNSKNLKVIQKVYVSEQVSETSELYTQSLDVAVNSAGRTGENMSDEYLARLPDKGASYYDLHNEMGIALVLENTATTKAQLFAEVPILMAKVNAFYAQTGSEPSTFDYTDVNKSILNAIAMLNGETPTDISLQPDGGIAANALIEEITTAQMLTFNSFIEQDQLDAEVTVLSQKILAYSIAK